MALENLVKKNLVSCRPTTAIREVAQQMESNNVGAVLIVEEDRPVGIVTDRDLVLRCILRTNDVERLTAAEVMTPKPETVSVCDGIFDVIAVMRRSEVRRVPIVDEAGKAVGLLSFGDILALLGKEISFLCEGLTPEEPKLEQAA